MTLPRSAQDIADVIGRELALRLIGQLEQAGGRKWRRVLYVPKRLDTDTGERLVAMIGRDAAERLRRHFGGEILQPANCGFLVRAFRAREVRRLAADGLSIEVIAFLTGVPEGRVRELARSKDRKPPEEPRADNDNLRASFNGGRVRRVEK